MAAEAGLSRPIRPGESMPVDFFESNHALEVDRERAFGFRLAIPAGASARVEPGEEKKVTLVAFGGNRIGHGVNGLTEGSLNDPAAKAKAVALAADRRFELKIIEDRHE